MSDLVIHVEGERDEVLELVRLLHQSRSVGPVFTLPPAVEDVVGIALVDVVVCADLPDGLLGHTRIDLRDLIGIL